MRVESTPARLRDLLESAFECAGAAGADGAELAAAALAGLLQVRRHLDGRIGPKGVWQLLDWMGDWLLRRELRARVLGLPHGLALPERTATLRTRLLVGQAVEAALAAIEAGGPPVLHLALAELLLDRLELHLGGLPEREGLIALLAREDAAATWDADVRTPLLQ